MSGLWPTILLIVTFLVLMLVLRVATRGFRSKPNGDTETDNRT